MLFVETRLGSAAGSLSHGAQRLVVSLNTFGYIDSLHCENCTYAQLSSWDEAYELGLVSLGAEFTMFNGQCATLVITAARSKVHTHVLCATAF